ncbi:MAG: hypothetical protein K0U90_10350 [Planctomycetes bacterium]|nr:hypothetical protein [Planctomycetota bacterium]
MPLKQFESPIKSWSVGVTTAPRAVSVLDRTLESLSRAGWPEIHVFAEPDSVVTHKADQCYWHQRGKILGAFSNWYISLTELVLLDPHADAYLLCQDDIVLSRDTRPYLEKVLWCNEGSQVLSIYCAEVHDEPNHIGFNQLDADWNTCGALALIFPNAVARALLCDPLFLDHRRNGPSNGDACIDSVLGRWCRRSNIRYYVHHPSLVQHTGHYSSLWGEIAPSPRRRAGSFLDESESALEWFNRKKTNSKFSS